MRQIANRHNQLGGGDGEQLAGFRVGFGFASYRVPHLTRKRDPFFKECQNGENTNPTKGS
jgi:hypothetical protein